MKPDIGRDDICDQGPPAQADGGDQESVKEGEVLDQGQLRPIVAILFNNTRVSIADG